MLPARIEIVNILRSLPKTVATATIRPQEVLPEQGGDDQSHSQGVPEERVLKWTVLYLFDRLRIVISNR